MNQVKDKQKRGTKGYDILAFVTSIVIPILALWNGIIYLVHKDYWKGGLLLLIFVVQLIIIIVIFGSK